MIIHVITKNLPTFPLHHLEYDVEAFFSEGVSLDHNIPLACEISGYTSGTW